MLASVGGHTAIHAQTWALGVQVDKLMPPQPTGFHLFLWVWEAERLRLIHMPILLQLSTRNLRQSDSMPWNCSCFNKMSTIVPLSAGCFLLILCFSLFCGVSETESYIFRALLVWIMQSIPTDLGGREEERSFCPLTWRYPCKHVIGIMFAVVSRQMSGTTHLRVVWRWDHWQGPPVIWVVSDFFKAWSGSHRPSLPCPTLHSLCINPLCAEVPGVLSLLLSELWQVDTSCHCLTASGYSEG